MTSDLRAEFPEMKGLSARNLNYMRQFAQAWGCDVVIMCRTVANITLSVPDAVYRAARVKAAERGSSVSALVADYLRLLSDEDAEFVRLEAQQRRIQAGIARFSARDRLSRDEAHVRAVR